MRSGKDSDSRRPITCGQRGHAALTWLHADQWSQRQRIARGELTPGQSPEPADQVRGSAAEDRGDGEAACHGKVASRAGSAGSDPQPRPGRHGERGVRRLPLSVDLYREVRPGHRDDPFVVEFEFGTLQRDLERRRFSRVARRGRWPGDATTDPLVRPAAPLVLAGPIVRCPAPSSVVPAEARAPMPRHFSAKNSTVSPGSSKKGVRSRQIEETQRRPANELPAAGTLHRIDPGLRPGDSDRSRRHSKPRRGDGAAPQSPGRRFPCTESREGIPS